MKITKDLVDKLTPRERFTKEHEQLRKQVEEWMRNTANSCMLVSLPIKLLIGVLMLFVSIACMVVAFSTAFIIAYDKTNEKIPMAIVVPEILPIWSFWLCHDKLVVDIWSLSTFSLRQRKKMLF